MYLHKFKSTSKRLSKAHLAYHRSYSTSINILSDNYSTPPPQKSRVVIIGGGIIGTSIAYHLGKLGWGGGDNGTIVLEQDRLTSGTTWHAAGLVETLGSTSRTSTDFRKYSRDLYRELEKETGVSTGYMQCGFIEIASEPHRLEEFRRVANFNRRLGVDVHEITPQEILKLFPLCNVTDVLAGFYCKEDGRVNPVDATMSLAKGAKMQGVRFYEGIRVSGVKQENGQVCGVYLENGGFIEAEYVVNCSGMWARQFGEKIGVNIPNQAAEHYYMITEAIPEVDPSWPVIEDPSSYTYVRPEGGGLMVGLFEPHAAAWNIGSIPDNSSFVSLSPDWERMTPFLEKAMNRVPVSLSAGIKTFFCGPESFTPDLSPILGESPELKNFFVAAGMNSLGILSGGGVGRLMAHWITTGLPDMDVTGVNIDRLHSFHSTPQYRSERVVEILGMVYKCHYPSHEMKTARNVKLSPLHSRLVEQGAYFREVSGWESPGTQQTLKGIVPWITIENAKDRSFIHCLGWYAPPGVKPEVDTENRTGFWNRENWFPYWKAEHEACRNGVVLIDMSFMSKFLVQGREAGKVLNYLSTANVNGDSGMITYTQWLNRDGKLEADLTIMKLTEEKFIVVATDTAHRHVETLITREIEKQDARAYVSDVTGSFCQINIQGPKSRELMQHLTNTDMGNEAFPFRSAQKIAIGFAWVTCVRITYVGELGYELYIPTEHAIHVYDKIIEANKKHNVGLVHAGLRALGSLRMEKGYRDYGHDLDNCDGLYETGLGFTCDFEKEGGFIGKDAVLAEKASPAKNRLVQVLVKDPEPLLAHAEVVFRNGKMVGDIRSASYGHTLGGAVGLCMVSAEEGGEKVVNKQFIETGEWEVQVAAKKYPAVVSLRPLYDPKNEKIKS